MTTTQNDKFDIRTRDRELRNGTIAKQDVEKYMKSLPDEASNAEEIPVFEEVAAEPAASVAPHGSVAPTFSAV
ncbi:MAG: hypothetical protein Q7T03_01885 [Deltaproteobacteria bacterium]|nr:hypothetical protein [Deltaproteobacteria bacterium]